MEKDYEQTFKKQFSESSDNELLESFNHHANPIWGGIKATYMNLLINEMKKRGIDFSAIEDESGWIKARNCQLSVMNGQKQIVPIESETLIAESEDIEGLEDDPEEYDEYENDDPEALYCPICEMKCVCDHLVMIYDETYNSVEGGDIYEYFDTFRSTLSDGLTGFLAQKVSNARFPIKSLQRLWISLQDQAPQSIDELDIDDRQFYEILIEVLIKNGAELSDEEGDSSTAPGFSSKESFFFAENPDQTIKNSLKTLKSCFE